MKYKIENVIIYCITNILSVKKMKENGLQVIFHNGGVKMIKNGQITKRKSEKNSCYYFVKET